jgi:hypothetical protein
MRNYLLKISCVVVDVTDVQPDEAEPSIGQYMIHYGEMIGNFEEVQVPPLGLRVK